jgi:hypothetical protein
VNSLKAHAVFDGIQIEIISTDKTTKNQWLAFVRDHFAAREA